MLFICVAEDLDSGATEKQIQVEVREGLAPGTAGSWVRQRRQLGQAAFSYYVGKRNSDPMQ